MKTLYVTSIIKSKKVFLFEQQNLRTLFYFTAFNEIVLKLLDLYNYW